MTAYDEVPYPGHTHPQTHPDRLAAAAVLHGLDPAPVERCRVLELGCGDGSNLLPMAFDLADSEFAGIDLAASRVAEGEARIAELGLNNIRLLAADLATVGPELGCFDYVIAHGVYSWVPAPVRDRLLAVCAEHLAPHGVAFVSYNALPGGHLSSMLREMLLFHVRDIREPRERIDQAQALLHFLAGASDAPDGYHQWMRAEANRVRGHERNHLYHDELAPINDPVFFKDFAAHAARHGLQFLAEADAFESSDLNFSPAARAALAQLSANRILREQYLDFLKCRRFRQTLLCRGDAPAAPAAAAARVSRLFASAVEETSWREADLRPGVTVAFATAKGSKIETDFAPGKAALAVLGEAWPACLALPDLAERAAERLRLAGLASDGATPEALGGFLLEIHQAGFAALRTRPPRCTPRPSPLPATSALARWQAAHGIMITSAFHTAVRVEDRLGLRLLALLDGTRDHATLAAEAWDFLHAEGALAETPGGEPEQRRAVAAELERNLGRLARIGLLVA
jgi:SAM-dependent methyltransferase